MALSDRNSKQNSISVSIVKVKTNVKAKYCFHGLLTFLRETPLEFCLEFEGRLFMEVENFGHSEQHCAVLLLRF